MNNDKLNKFLFDNFPQYSGEYIPQIVYKVLLDKWDELKVIMDNE